MSLTKSLRKMESSGSRSDQRVLNAAAEAIEAVQ